MKGVETGVCQKNDGGTRTLVDSNILNKKMFSDLTKSMLWLKTRQFILYDKFSTRKSNLMCTNVCWLLNGVETGDSRIYVWSFDFEVKHIHVCFNLFKNNLPYLNM